MPDGHPTVRHNRERCSHAYYPLVDISNTRRLEVNKYCPWCALTNSKTCMALSRSPERTKRLLLPGSPTPCAAACFHAANELNKPPKVTLHTIALKQRFALNGSPFGASIYSNDFRRTTYSLLLIHRQTIRTLSGVDLSLFDPIADTLRHQLEFLHQFIQHATSPYHFLPSGGEMPGDKGDDCLAFFRSLLPSKLLSIVPGQPHGYCKILLCGLRSANGICKGLSLIVISHLAR